ncbi:MAG TPA: hypothetical protein VGR37_04025 [Longimicrobiaceae bacterium]|nr:hypothetical protein [Longimicrobiaceae bacterium]
MPRVVCLEGPSAVGKTSLAAALARECGAAVVPELDARGAPPVASSAGWFADRHAELWRAAVEQTPDAPFAVLDGDPFKGLWYNWIYAGDGWPGPDAVAPAYRSHLERGTLGFPDLYVVLGATEAHLRQRRADDRTRSRRGFERHLRMVGPQRRYFVALQAAAPGRVAFVESADREALVGRVLKALERLPPDPPDPVRLFDRMVEWVRSHSPADPAG